MGSSGGGSSGGSKTKPWKAQKPYLEQIYGEAANLYGAAPTALEAEATGLQTDRARAGSPLISGAQGLTEATLRGDYLNSNPWLDATYDQAAGRVSSNYMRTVLPNIETRFGGTGRRNSGAYGAALRGSTDQLGRSLGDLATNIYGGNYQAERGRQQQAAQMARPLAREDYYDIEQLRNAGLDPWERLGRFSSAIGAPVSSSKASNETLPGWASMATGGLV
jgi:hypothetical protein